MEFKDRVAFITGGAGGIGEEIGRLFLEKGCKIFEQTWENTVTKKLQNDFGKSNVLFVKCDITNDKEFEDAYNTCEKELGKITILCNNAGVFAKDYRTSMDINFVSKLGISKQEKNVQGAIVTGTDLALKRMGKHNGGEGGFIVNTASMLGAVRAPFTPMYSATKAAVIHYTRCMGHEFNYDYSGVHMHSVCPTAVDTPLTTLEGSKKGSLNEYTDKLLDEINDNAPRLKPREVAEAIVQVLEDHKPGAALVVDAGVKPYYMAPSLLTEYS
ncbi:15-hydroxyprostaglandin dehydrogenase [NAD(+)] [Armadillidium vulgare]|nr:15-hydroxyprostaglandin dehydrogenase [NAD(+)] [Armadillidium vulgare]